MIKEIRYKNFKALRDVTLPLGRFTLIVGANGTGKTTAMQTLKWITKIDIDNLDKFLSTGLYIDFDQIEVKVVWDKSDIESLLPFSSAKILSDVSMIWDVSILTDKTQPTFEFEGVQGVSDLISDILKSRIKSFKVFSFDAEEIAEPVAVRPNIELNENGKGLAGVLDQLRDNEPEKFEELNRELRTWFPEFDRILFETPHDGTKAFLLRTKIGQHKIRAKDLSDGTRLALAYLPIAYLPNAPQIIAFEEPERGIHPRLLRNIQEAMDRLAYPENYGENRKPVQVIATTHSPYLLDLYKDRREEIVISDKDENGVHFERLTDLPNIEKILQEQDAPLGDVWFSGILGGVPAQL